MEILISLTALIFSVVALFKISNIKDQIGELMWKGGGTEAQKTKVPAPPPVIPKPIPLSEMKPLTKPVPVQPPEMPMQTKADQALKEEATTTATSKPAKKDNAGFEQVIGTRWVLIAGVITIFFGVAFFLKYAYETFSIGPMGRVISVATGGLIALIIGEITRRRGYEIVAKGVTALGFAILYAAVFSAHRFYGLIGSASAFALAIAVTAGAMAYAAKLDEVLIAFLSLLGGFVTPVIVSTGENRPMLLFSYVLILSVGSMLCASYRKWRAVNFLSFAGTFILYSGWLVKFYRTRTLEALIEEPQIAIALSWLGIFFMIYLILPVIFELIKKVHAKKEDVLLILANAGVTFFYLSYILHTNHRSGLALGAVLLCAAHLGLMLLSHRRNADDKDLLRVLLSISIFFLTIALPLYLKMHVLTMAWAAEAVIFVVIGLRYRSILTQIGGAIAFVLSCGSLIVHLPMHTGEFRFILNPVFGTWCFVAAAAYIYHLVYRTTNNLSTKPRDLMAQVPYAIMCLILFAAATMEWYAHCDFNLEGSQLVTRGQFLIFSGLLLLFVRPFCPEGKISKTFTWLGASTGSLFIITQYIQGFHVDTFRVFLNPDFAAGMIFIAMLGLHHFIYRQRSSIEDDEAGINSQIIFCLAGITLFIIATMEWYWHCEINLLRQAELHYISPGQMVIFAGILMLFTLRPLCPTGKLNEIVSLFIVAAGSIFTIWSLFELHKSEFTIFFNINFIIVIVFLIAMLIFHIKYRQAANDPSDQNSIISQIVYVILGSLLMVTVMAEWYWNCRYNLVGPSTDAVVLQGQIVIITIIMLLFSLRPLCPPGIISKIMAVALGTFGSLFVIITFAYFYEDSFMIFANREFAIAALFVAGLFLSGKLMAKNSCSEQQRIKFSTIVYLMAIFVLWILSTEEVYLFWKCLNKYANKQPNWEFLAHMYISILWAVYGAVLMAIGFWKKLSTLRYIALGLFVLLLAKVFIFDTSEVENVYRIAAFLATGIVLVGVSYLYQFLKNKGFFEALLTETTTESLED